MRRTTALLLISASLVVAPTAAYAAKPSANGGSSGSGFTVPDGVYGGTTVASVSNPPADTWVVATCYQGGTAVIFNRVATDSAGHATLQLGPTTSYQAGIGGASCNAEAKYWNNKRQRWISIATTTFHVSD